MKNLYFAVPSSQFPVPSSQFPVPSSQFVLSISRILVCLALFFLLFFASRPVNAASAQCTVNLSNALTLTHTRQWVTHSSAIACSGIPASATITNTYLYFLFNNLTSSGTTEVRLVAAGREWVVPVTWTLPAPPTGVVVQGSDNSPIFNGLLATTAFTLSARHQDPSTAPNGYPIPPMPMTSFQLIVTYEYQSTLQAAFAVSTDALTASFQNQTSGGYAPISYAWDFGDGGSTTTTSPSHTYAIAGTYTVNLRATDSFGEVKYAQQSVIVTSPPPTLDVTSADYLYNNCTNYIRNGRVNWGAVTDATNYEFQEKVGTVYNTLYSGPNTYRLYGKTADFYPATSVTYNLRVRASNATTTGAWFYFVAKVPTCWNGGEPLP